MRRSLYRCAVILILVSLSTIVHAGDDFDNPRDLFCKPGQTAGNNPAFGGKPVSLFSGMETFAPSTDLTLGNIYPISVTRSYNSHTTYDSPLGYGWAFNYDKRLYTYGNGSVTIRRECGGKTRFTVSGGVYVGQSGDSGTLVQNADGTFTYTDLNGNAEKYDDRGRLLAMSDAKGNSLAFYYEVDSKSALWGLLPANVDQSSTRIVAFDYRLSRIEEKDSAGNLTNHWVLFHYDSFSGRVTDIIDSAGRSVTYGHDGIGNLTSASGPATNSAYGYTDPNNNHLINSIDEGQGAYVNTYDASGRVTSQTHGSGTITFNYVTPLQKTIMTTTIAGGPNGPLTQTRTVEFDTNGRPSKVTDTFGNVATYVRDSNAWVLAEGHYDVVTGVTTTTAYAYDAFGNVLTKTEAQGSAVEKTTTYTYDPIYNGVITQTVQSVVNSAQNRITTNTYDDATGNLLTTTETGLLGNGNPYAYTTAYTYDVNGRPASIDGPRTDVADVTSYNYDPATGYLLSMTQPLIGTTSYSNFDSLGNPQVITDPNNNSTAYTYDTNGRVSTVKAPGDTNPTQYFYVSGGCGASCGGNGKIDHITLPEGNTITYHYDDGMGNLTSISDSLGNTINYTYDSAGNKLTEQIKDSSGSLQKSLSYSYDALNRLSQVINPDNSFTQYGYDSLGNRTSLQTPKGPVTTYAYDALSRLIAVSQPGSVNTGYGYDTNNNLTAVTDANGHATTYKFDDKGRVYQIISPDTGTTTYQYDPADNMISKTDAKGVTISYTYDAANRLTRIHFPSDTDTVYAYDSCVNGKGHLCSMTDASGTTAYDYSAKGKVTKETKTIDGNIYVTQYSYDQNSNIKTMTYPSGKVITYNLSNDKVISVLNGAANLATNIGYKPFGGMSAITYGNGIVGGVSYDNQYRITGMTAGTVMNLSYPTYDANGNIAAINNVLDATKNRSFGYDALDRLSSATASGIWGSLSWTYDGVGNRLSENTNVYTYTPGTNKLATANGLSFAFDNNGNTTGEGAKIYTYNQNQRLITVVNGSTTGNYTYNGRGQRVKKVVNGTTTIYHYNHNGLLLAESNSSGAITTEYVYLNGQPLAMLAGSSAYYYYHNDNLGTPQKMTDSTGAVVWAADYKPFGEVTITVSTITNNLRFPGQYYDAETGLHYNYFRDYNPAVGKYIEADPWNSGVVLRLQARLKMSIRVFGPDSLNDLSSYPYAENNSIRYTDVFGLKTEKDCNIDFIKDTLECEKEGCNLPKKIICKWKAYFKLQQCLAEVAAGGDQ